MTAVISETIAKAIYAARNGKGCKPWRSQTKAHKEPYLLDAKAALSALAAEGFAVVPKEPSTAALDSAVAFALNVTLSGDYNWSAYMRDVYRRMIEASQEPNDASD